jgi:hypothetical protein
MTEDCFQRTVLEFASPLQTIIYEDESKPALKIPAVDVSEGTTPAGSVWRRNPLPACNWCVRASGSSAELRHCRSLLCC